MKIKFFLITLIAFTQFSYSQNHSLLNLMVGTNANFKNIQSASKQYLDSMLLLNPTDSNLIHDVKMFKRWEKFYSSKTHYPDAPVGGDFANIDKFVTNTSLVCNTSVGGSIWNLVGPKSINGQNMGRLISVAVDPTNYDVIYAGSFTSGLWKSVDGGVNWFNVTDVLRVPILGITSISIDPSNTNIIFISTGYNDDWMNHAKFGTGVYKSLDGGLTWLPTGLSFPFPSSPEIVEVVKVHPTMPNIIIAAGGKNIYRSNDGGNSFTISSINGLSADIISINDLEFSLADPSIIYASTNWNGSISLSAGAQFFVSADFGLSWNSQSVPNINYLVYNPDGTFNLSPSSGSKASGQIAIDVTPAEPNAVYIAYSNGKYQYILKSLDNGINWSQENIVNSSNWTIASGKFVFEVSNQNSSNYYIGSIRMRRKIGTAWSSSLAGIHDDMRGMIQMSTSTGNDYLVLVNDGGISRNTNAQSSNFVDITGNGLSISLYYGFDDSQVDGSLTGGTQDDGTNYYNPQTNIWSHVAGGDGGKCFVDDFSAVDANTTVTKSYGVSNESVLFSNTAGASFYSTTNPEYNASTQGGWTLDLGIYHQQLSNTIWFAQEKLWYYNGINWILKWSNPDPALAGKYISTIEISEKNPQIIFLAYKEPTWQNVSSIQTKKFYKSVDGGTTFTDFTPYIHYSGLAGTHYFEISDILIDPENENNIYLAFDGYWEDANGNGKNRVIHSTDGGYTWADISIGLPGFSVNTLEFYKGTDGYIFAGNHVGIYLFDPNDGIWKCFNSNLPIVPVSNIEINYCKGKVLCSTYGRGIFEANLPNIAGEIQITQSKTILPGTIVIYDRNIVIEQGSVLTVKGILSMAEGKKIVVKRGGTIIVDGGKITNTCGNMWQGIEVWGNRNASQQTIGAQGKVILKNNAIIENSIDGIVTIRKDSNGNLDWNYTGGIVQATNSTFLNCRNGATFLSYHNFHPSTGNAINNISFFKNCVFKIDAQLNDATKIPDSGISLYDIIGLRILGCDFINTTNDMVNSGRRGKGILSYDAKFTVDDLCTGITYPCNIFKQNTFSDLEYGVYCSNANVFYAPYINHAKFKGNRFDGVHLSGVYYPTIQNCDFDVSSYFDYGGAGGLYLDYCKYYSVQNNYFHTTENGWVGIYVKDSKTGAHELYNNTFEGLYVGIEPLRDNSGISNFSDGLTMHCNVFTANHFDIAVTGYTSPSIGKNSIAWIQGLNIPTTPPGMGLVRNTYSASCGSENQYFMYINEPKAVQHHANSDAFTRPTPQPTCSDNLVNVVNSGISFNRTQHCPDLTQLNNTLITAKIAQSTGEIDQLRQNYASIVDGGNTNALINSIIGNLSPGILKNLLLSKSPYLSDEVLIAYLTMVNSPPNGHIKDVIIANSPVTETVKEKIDLLNLPIGIKNQINAAQSKNLSSRQFLEAQIVQLEYEKQLNVSDKIRYFLNDTLETNPLDSLITLIKQYPRSNNPCEIVSAYVTKGDYVKAQAVVDSLQAINQVDDFCEFQKIILQLNQATEKCFKLRTDVPLKDKVEEIAGDCTKDGCCNAQALLKQVFDYHYQELRMLPEENRSALIENESIPSLIENGLSIYPNPANDFVNILFNDDEAEFALLVVKDVLGKTIDTISLKVAESKLYDVQMLKGGVYFFSLYINDTIIENKKIVLVK